MISLGFAFVRLYRVIREGLGDPEFRGILAAALGVLIGGMIFYMVEEGWSWVDALYFCVTTLTTIGFGDPSPTTDLSKIFTVCYVILGIGIVATFVASVADRSRRIGDERRRKER